MRIPLTCYGLRELLLVALAFGGAAAAGPWAFPAPWGTLASAAALLGLVFSVSFFRDPERPLPPDDALVVSPSDGTVADVIELHHHPFMDGPCHRVGIFLSVFDVHVNRAPLTGTVEHLHYRPGGYLDARDPAASEENEAQEVGFSVEDAEGRRWPVLVTQIAGLIARRIVCRLEMGAACLRGERFGMIKFGSRTEIFLPAGLVEHVEVAVGQKVKGGRDVIARLKVAVPDVPRAAEAAPSSSS